MMFLGDVVEREDYPDMSVCASLGATNQLDSYTPSGRLEGNFLSASSLYMALKTLEIASGREWSDFKLWLLETVDNIWLCSAVSYAANPRGLEQQAQSRIVRLVCLVRQYTGASWYPDTVLLETKEECSLLFKTVLNNPRIIPGAAFSAIPIPRQLLSLKSPHTSLPGKKLPTGRSLKDASLSWTLVQSLRKMLPGYVLEEHLCIESIAEIVCVSSRTLQRALSDEGVTFRQLINEAKFEVAKSALTETAMTVETIGNMLGYANATHFSRAFRRFSGLTPSCYRNDIADNPLAGQT